LEKGARFLAVSSNGGSIPPLAYFEFFKNILIKIYEKH